MCVRQAACGLLWLWRFMCLPWRAKLCSSTPQSASERESLSSLSPFPCHFPPLIPSLLHSFPHSHIHCFYHYSFFYLAFASVYLCISFSHLLFSLVVPDVTRSVEILTSWVVVGRIAKFASFCGFYVFSLICVCVDELWHVVFLQKRNLAVLADPIFPSKNEPLY